MIKNFHEVIPNIIYRGSAPSKLDVILLKSKFGINKIISLDQVSGEHINKICKVLGIQHIIIGLNEKIKSLLYLFSLDFDNLFFNNFPVYIHCKHGRDRTGLVSAIIKIKYLHWSPEKALNEAKSFGFGEWADPKMINLYEKIIKSLNNKTQNDINDADIVDNTREHDDFSGSVLDSVTMQSFAPYMDGSKWYPFSPTYNYRYEQFPTRNNYNLVPDTEYGVGGMNGDQIPQIGLYDSNDGVRGVGPVDNGGGFTAT